MLEIFLKIHPQGCDIVAYEGGIEVDDLQSDQIYRSQLFFKYQLG